MHVQGGGCTGRWRSSKVYSTRGQVERHTVVVVWLRYAPTVCFPRPSPLADSAFCRNMPPREQAPFAGSPTRASSRLVCSPLCPLCSSAALLTVAGCCAYHVHLHFGWRDDLCMFRLERFMFRLERNMFPFDEKHEDCGFLDIYYLPEQVRHFSAPDSGTCWSRGRPGCTGVCRYERRSFRHSLRVSPSTSEH